MTINVCPLSRSVKHVDEFLDVAKRKARGRLVKDVDRVLVGHAAQFAGQFHTLGLTARQGRSRLSESDVAQTDRIKRSKGAVNFPMVLEEINRFGHRHFQHVVDGAATPLHLEAFARVPLAVANIAGDPHVGKEIHF